MDHDATREQMELAALEPAGIERLMAGDTPTAQAVAAHLTGCPACTGELARLERASKLIGAAVRETPPADLRERTLATVRALGRTRGVPALAGAAPGGLASEVAVPMPIPAAGPMRSPRGRRVAVGWIAAIAAAVVLSVATTSLVVGWRVDRSLAAQTETIGALQEVTTGTLRVTSEPDARHVVLTAASNPNLNGTLVFSPSTSELVVVTTGLTLPPSGQEYRCWVERAGERERVGKMFFSGDLAYWIGPVSAVSGLSGGARFGVSLVDAAGAATDTAPILAGGL
jgi:hypothetical protein